MGSLFKTPSYSPPAAQKEADKLLEEREARAEASEKKELRKLAAKRRASRGGGRLLFSQDRAIPQLGVGGKMSTIQSYVRNPYEDERSA